MTLTLLIGGTCFLARYSTARVSLGRLAMFACGGMVGAICLWYAWDAYYTLRQATNATGGWQEFSILDLDAARAEAARLDGGGFLENLIARPFGPAVSVAVFQETAVGVMWGWNAVSQVLLAIPAAFFPDKIYAIGPTLENLWTASLGVPSNDWTNTLFLEGYSDFGPAGFPIYLTVFVLLSAILTRLARQTKSGAVQVFMFFVITSLALNIETTTAGVLSAFRSLIAVLIIAKIVVVLVHTRKKRHAPTKSMPAVLRSIP